MCSSVSTSILLLSWAKVLVYTAHAAQSWSLIHGWSAAFASEHRQISDSLRKPDKILSFTWPIWNQLALIVLVQLLAFPVFKICNLKWSSALWVHTTQTENAEVVQIVSTLGKYIFLANGVALQRALQRTDLDFLKSTEVLRFKGLFLCNN